MKDILLELMQNAADNDQPVWDWPAYQIAWEIQAYVDDFAEADHEQMVKAIEAIQAERSG